jgi:hypothetical protein
MSLLLKQFYPIVSEALSLRCVERGECPNCGDDLLALPRGGMMAGECYSCGFNARPLLATLLPSTDPDIPCYKGPTDV